MEQKRYLFIERQNILWKSVLSRIDSPFERMAVNQNLKDMYAFADQFPKQSIKDMPNCKHFEITALANWSLPFFKHNILKREEPAKYDIIAYRNGRMRRWVRHQLNRLENQRHNPRNFWKIAKMLMRSPSFQITCYQEIFPGWHRTEKYWKVWSTIKTYYKKYLTGELPPGYEYHITTLPEINKPEGRPLSVPAVHDRLRHRMLYHILYSYLKPYIASNQHGFIPGRGTLSCWRDIIKGEIYKQPYIYEYDFKKFYDRIDLSALKKLLTALDIPEEVTLEIIDGYRSNPTYGTLAPHQSWTTKIEALKKISLEKYDINYYNLPLSERRNLYHLQTHYPIPYINYFGIGQGSPLSPLLATLILNPILIEYPDNIIQYADDGLIYGNNEAVIEEIKKKLENPTYNLSLAPAPKSRYLKKAGEWIYPEGMRFIGISYIPSLEAKYLEGYLYQHPRSGLKAFRFDNYELIEDAFIYDQRAHETESSFTDKTLMDYFCDKQLGYIQSRIFNGSMSLDKITQDFNYSYIDYSWSAMMEKYRNTDNSIYKDTAPDVSINIYNSSSLACELLVRRTLKQLKRKIKKYQSNYW